MNFYSTSCPSIYRGVVEDNKDPRNIGRCRVRVPAIHGDIQNISILPWARPVVTSNVSAKRGSVNIPDVGDIVWVMFEGTNRDYPIYFGGTYSEEDFKVDPSKVILYLDDGNMVYYDRNTGSYQLNSGSNSILLSKNRISIVGDIQVSGNLTVSGSMNELGIVSITSSVYDEPESFASGSMYAPGGDTLVDNVTDAMNEEELNSLLEDIDDNQDTFLYWVKTVKALMAAKNVVYNQEGYVVLNIKGVDKKVRTDCSGLVSAMVSAYSGTEILMSSTGYVDKASLEGFTKITNITDFKAGDVCARRGHIEVYAYRKDGKDYVYNGGDTGPLRSPGPTLKGPGGYDVIWRPNK